MEDNIGMFCLCCCRPQIITWNWASKGPICSAMPGGESGTGGLSAPQCKWWCDRAVYINLCKSALRCFMAWYRTVRRNNVINISKDGYYQKLLPHYLLILGYALTGQLIVDGCKCCPDLSDTLEHWCFSVSSLFLWWFWIKSKKLTLFKSL